MNKHENDDLEHIKTNVTKKISDFKSAKGILEKKFYNNYYKSVLNGINEQITKCENIKNKLDNLNTNSYTNEYLESHPELMEKEMTRRLHNDQRCY